ncbi:hypothetical protein CBR_g44596 [Chara braunii]|uniref:Uncharacterized protein n=1 Tax=Chara braunii TaxID=69332 RepID=A0A388LY50_CHABU|nr:hypothetical protein CBR_g44596 [Chara braunii]|eukprot:GBG87139.1 hypothetical protein CBR_g44596 [Chara braunii]
MSLTKKNKEVDRKNEKLVKKLESLERVPKKEEASSSEKRKRVIGVNSPAVAERHKLRSRSRSGGIKLRQPWIEVSSDDDDERKKAQEATIEGPPPENVSSSNNVNLEDVMKMLAIIAAKTNQGNENHAVEAKPEDEEASKGSRATNPASTEENNDDSEDEEGKLKVNRGGESGRVEVGIVEYMRQQLDHYMEITGKKIKGLCLKRDVKWVQKDKSAWELAKQDTEEFTRLMNGEGEEEEAAKSGQEEYDDDEETDNAEGQKIVSGN